MNSEFMKVNLKDVSKALVVAVLGAVLVALYKIVSAPGFDIFTVDWNMVLQTSINAAVGAFVGYISKQLFSTEDGKFLGKIG